MSTGRVSGINLKEFTKKLEQKSGLCLTEWDVCIHN